MSLLFEFARPQPFFSRPRRRVPRVRRQTRDLFDRFFAGDDFFFPAQRTSFPFDTSFMRDDFFPSAFDTHLFLDHQPHQRQPERKQKECKQKERKQKEHKQMERKSKESSASQVATRQPQQLFTSWGNTDFSLQASDDGKYYYVEYSIPNNVDPSNLKASLRGNTLSLSGKQRNEWGDESSRGWSVSSFHKSLPIPEDIVGSLQRKTIQNGHKLLVRIPRQPQDGQHAKQQEFLDEKHNTSTAMDVEGPIDVDFEQEEDIDDAEQEEKDTVDATEAAQPESTGSAMQVESDVDIIPIEEYEIVTIDDDSDEEA